MKRKTAQLRAVLAAILVIASLMGCTAQSTKEEPKEGPVDAFLFTAETLPAIDGSTACIPLCSIAIQRLTGMSEAEAEKYCNLFSTTRQAYSRLANDEADLLLVYEGGYMDDFEGTLEFHPIGLDALVFLTGAKNPVDGLTSEQVRGIYTGAITDWSEVGGEAGEIAAYQRPTSSGSGAMLEKHVLAGEAITEAPQRYIISEMGSLISELAQFQGGQSAIGYSVYYYVANMYAHPDLKLFFIDGVAPSNETIADASYPYVSQFYAVIRQTSAEGSPERRMVAWLESAEGKRAITDAGYVAIP